MKKFFFFLIVGSILCLFTIAEITMGSDSIAKDANTQFRIFFWGGLINDMEDLQKLTYNKKNLVRNKYFSNDHKINHKKLFN